MCVLSDVASYGATFKTDYDKMVGNKNNCARSAHLLGSVITIALFVIGCMTAAGAFPHAAFGWTTLGLGLGYLAAKFLGGSLRERKVDWISGTLLAALVITLGSLGVGGVLADAQIGYALIGVAALTFVMVVTMMVTAYITRKNTQIQ